MLDRVMAQVFPLYLPKKWLGASSGTISESFARIVQMPLTQIPEAVGCTRNIKSYIAGEIVMLLLAEDWTKKMSAGLSDSDGLTVSQLDAAWLDLRHTDDEDIDDAEEEDDDEDEDDEEDDYDDFDDDDYDDDDDDDLDDEDIDDIDSIDVDDDDDDLDDDDLDGDLGELEDDDDDDDDL